MKKILLLLSLVIISSLALGACRLGKAKDGEPNATPAATPKPRTNLIDVKDRPYVTLQPLKSRNELEFVVHNLPKEAKNVEVLLEYDRNKGVLDAVLKNFTLGKVPYVDKLFMGSKSSGGHITYHDDVIGGKLLLTFSGKEDYALEVPWRYNDTQPHYTELSTVDQRFQITLDKPFRTEKVVIMQSPGLPAAVDGKVLAGPYLIRGVGPLPETQTKITIRLSEEASKPKLLGYNGQKWQELPSSIDGKTLTATVPLLETYVVVE